MLLAAALFAVPARPFAMVGRPPVSLRAPRLAQLPPLAIVMSEDAGSSYRVLGLPEDATYDQIMDAYIELSERYVDDVPRMAALDAAKEKVLDDRLRQRMSGSLQASYDGMTAREDRPEPVKTPWWVIANDIRKKLFELPTPKYALQVFAILGGLTLATWLAPSTAGTILLINVVSGMGFIYNRGQPEVVRDDFGQIGEIRPMQPKPFALTAAITFVFWMAGFLKAKQMIAAMASPPRGLEAILRTTLISGGLIIPALFVKVHPVFE
jgi:hypothetical protein